MTTPEHTEIDTANWQMAGRNGGDVVVLMPRQRMTNDEALTHAAWLVMLATFDDDEPGERFAAVFAAVRST